ncbi:MAG: archease [Candidatus Zixiibacteriota bacterium]|nr:MAG: archease [candidate division Zixibacteria bacterium]
MDHRRISGLGNYEFIDHTADIAVRAYGDTLAEAFATAGRAMFDIITDSSLISPAEEKTFEVEAMDLEGLLVGFLSELIVLHDAEGWVFDQLAVRLSSKTGLTTVAKGEKFNTARHRHGTHVKGVSYHMMEVVEPDGRKPAHVQVLFDI